jgi:uncharacterized protein YaaQ
MTKYSLKKNTNMIDLIQKTEFPTSLWLTSKNIEIDKKGRLKKSKKKSHSGGNLMLNINKLAVPVVLWLIGEAIEGGNIKKLFKWNNKEIQSGGNLIQQVNALSVPVALWLIREGIGMDNNNNLIYKKKNDKHLKGGSSTVLYNINKLAVPVVLWLISQGLDIDNKGKMSKSSKIDSKVKQTAGSLMYQVNKLAVPVVLWLISRGLDMDNEGNIIPLKKSKIQSGGNLMLNINKLSVPVILWLISEALDNNSKKKNENHINMQLKNRMTKTVGGSGGLWGNIAQLILIPGVYILCSIGLKNMVDNNHSFSDSMGSESTQTSVVDEKKVDELGEDDQEDEENDNAEDDEDGEDGEDGEDDKDIQGDDEVKQGNDEDEIEQKLDKEGGFIRDGSTQFFTHLERSKMNCAPNNFYNLTNQHTQRNIPPKDFSSVNGEQARWASDPIRW